MKKFFTKNKIKYISIICFTTLIIATVFGVATLFLDNNNEENKQEEIEYEEFTTISIDKEIKQQNLNVLLEVNNQLFSDKNIKNNIIKISKNAIDNCSDFKSENIADYDLKLRYFLDENLKDLKINIFMYNKLIKNKKFKTFYRIYII